jgi:hypothetical protein
MVTAVIFGFAILAIGLTLIIGNIARWKVLVDPPEEWTGYTHYWLKRTFGARFLVWFNYILGVVFVLFSIAFLLQLRFGHVVVR